MLKKIAIGIIATILLLLGVGKLLDLEDERVIHQLYVRDKDGVILKLEPKALTRGYNSALVLIHGYSSSPDTFTGVINDIQDKVHADIYAPLLPYHGRELATLAQMDNTQTIQFVKQYLDDLAKKYKTVTVVGFSYGGDILIHLASHNALPANIKLVLYNPAIFLHANTLFNRSALRTYGLWRAYSNYKELGNDYPGYGSVDEAGIPAKNSEISLRYDVFPAILTLFQMDFNERQAILNIKRPFDLISSVDDNQVTSEKLREACEMNKAYCHFYSIPSGRHLVHYGANKGMIEQLLIQLTTPSENAGSVRSAN